MLETIGHAQEESGKGGRGGKGLSPPEKGHTGSTKASVSVVGGRSPKKKGGNKKKYLSKEEVFRVGRRKIGRIGKKNIVIHIDRVQPSLSIKTASRTCASKASKAKGRGKLHLGLSFWGVGARKGGPARSRRKVLRCAGFLPFVERGWARRGKEGGLIERGTRKRRGEGFCAGDLGGGCSLVLGENRLKSKKLKKKAGSGRKSRPV